MKLFSIIYSFLGLLGLLATVVTATCPPPAPNLFLTCILPITSPLNDTATFSFSSTVIRKGLQAAVLAANLELANKSLPSLGIHLYDSGSSSASLYGALATAAVDPSLAETLFLHGPLTPQGDNAVQSLAEEAQIPYFDQHPYATATSPFFFRITAVMDSYVRGFSEIMTQHLGAFQMSVVSEESGTFFRVASAAIPLLVSKGIKVPVSIVLKSSGPESISRQMYEDALDQLIAADARYVALLLTPASFARFVYYAKLRGMFGVIRRDPWVIVGPISEVVAGINAMAQSVRDAGIPHNSPESVPASFYLPPDATMDFILSAMDGGLVGNYYGTVDAQKLASLEKAYISLFSSIDADFTGYTQFTGDFVSVASGLIEMAASEGRLCELYGGTRNSTYVLSLLKGRTFIGPSGELSFTSEGEKRSSVLFLSTTYIPATAANNYTASLVQTNKLLLHPFDDSWHTFEVQADGTQQLREDAPLTWSAIQQILRTFQWNTLVPGAFPPEDSTVLAKANQQNKDAKLVVIITTVVGGTFLLMTLFILSPLLQAKSFKRTVLIRETELTAARVSQNTADKELSRKTSSPSPDEEEHRVLFQPKRLYGTQVHLQTLPFEAPVETPYPPSLKPIPVGRKRLFSRAGHVEPTNSRGPFWWLKFSGRAHYGFRNPALPYQVALALFLKKLQNRNVVQCCGVVEWEETGQYSLVLEELVQSLKLLSLQGFRMKLKKKAMLIRDICQGLSYLMEVVPYGPDRPVLRYGIRPSHIFLDRWGTAKVVPTVSDSFAGEILQRNNTLFSLFIAPEVLAGRPATEASDVFTCAVISWMILNNVREDELAVYAESGAAFIEVGRLNLPWKADILDTFPKKVPDVIGRALSFNPRDRPTLADLVRMTDCFNQVRTFADNSFYNI